MVHEVILRFNTVSFWYNPVKPLLDEVSFSVRQGSKITLMGQNGGGKSTIFKLILGQLEPEQGTIAIKNGLTIAIGRQVVPRDELELSIRDFFAKAFRHKVYDLDPRIAKVLKVVNLSLPLDRALKSCSGGQQARLLLAYALIQEPDILLLDEPTNNLDKEGIEHLRAFLKSYSKTVLVISHDAEFLNSFTEGVLYLDVHTRKIEQYTGNYFDVVTEIQRTIERQRRENVRLEKEIEARKEKANFFAQKGGHMRDVAKKMRDQIVNLEGDKMEMREEDKTIRSFIIPAEEDLVGDILTLSSVSVVKDHKVITKKVSVTLKKGEHLLLAGPNGMGKSTLLESIALGKAKGAVKAPGVRIGYYRQDFSTLDFGKSVYETLLEHAANLTKESMRGIAAGFLLTQELMGARVGDLSEGQKGLLMFTLLTFQRPGLLLVDEPTNHMNFRHIPVIAEALSKFEGAMILVSHVREFVEKIRIDKVLDLSS